MHPGHFHMSLRNIALRHAQVSVQYKRTERSHLVSATSEVSNEMIGKAGFKIHSNFVYASRGLVIPIVSL